MKAIMVMFDTLNRRFLPPYGAEGIHAPNFTRLAERTAMFDTCYAGSMPCMPARRELHTGRHNFLHRSWGPLEPFDDSMPQILRENGVHTHLVTDHQHYWEDGGATYHNRYRTFEFFRGQEGDTWKGHVADPDVPEAIRVRRGEPWRQDWINRQYLTDEADHPQTRTFDAGLEFLHTNHAEDDWFLQIETFDPHEPFFSYARHKQHYAHAYDGPHFDWPDYKKVSLSGEQIDHARRGYAALLSMCDASLGRVLDTMDTLALWDDTLLIVCTDHGLLLGEHGWWGKNVQPWYDETIHTPPCSSGIRAAGSGVSAARPSCRPSTWRRRSWTTSASPPPPTCRAAPCARPSPMTPRYARRACSVPSAATSASPTAATYTCAPARSRPTVPCTSTPSCPPTCAAASLPPSSRTPSWCRRSPSPRRCRW
ncbi:sulfatase-like hydrolase/transferase [Streptomyces sp. NPDC087845]|uniref:sulfatase n=1 Tax=Streptomyces sp. NPDC087845 TaxID=3365806 RepID=UPI00381EF94D